MRSEDDPEAIVREVLELVLKRTIGSGERLERDKEPRWDSLAHIEILFSLEDACQVAFDEAELPRLTTSDRLVASILKHRES